MRHALTALTVLLSAYPVVYLIWLRRVVLDLPVALRIAFSVVPCCLLYRVIRAGRFSEFFILAAGDAALLLYHFWRDVKPDDFKRRRGSHSLFSGS